MCGRAADMPIDDVSVDAVIVRADLDDPTAGRPLDELWAAVQRRLLDIEEGMFAADWNRADREAEELRLLRHAERLAEASLRMFCRDCDRNERRRDRRRGTGRP